MKRLTFAFVIVLALFVLGGCDKLLEGFFPEDTDSGQNSGGGGSGADYSVAVSIEYDFNLISNGFGPSTSSTAVPIVAAFIPFTTSYDGSYQVDRNGIQYKTLYQNTFREDTDGQDSRTTVTFDTWNYSTYKVLVWFDVNRNNDPGIDVAPVEPGTLAIQNGNGNYWVDFRTMNPQNAGIQMSCRVGFNSIINVQQLTADPYATYAPGGMPPNAVIYSETGNNVAQNSTVNFNSYSSYATDGWITGWEWTITDQYNYIIYGYGPEISNTFSTIGPYEIKLRVKDNKESWSSWTAPYNLYVYQLAGGTTEVTVYDYYADYQVTTDIPISLVDAGEYFIHWEDSYQNSTSPIANPTYTGDMSVSAFDSIGNPFFQNTDSAYTYPISIYVASAQTITIRVDPSVYSTPGTCRVWITKFQ